VPRIDLPIDKNWAWGGASGAGITVAVVDSGVDAAHPAVGAIDRAVALRWDSETEEVISTDGPHEDLFGHGTACAGIIRRAAPDATLWSVRVLGSRLTGKGVVFAAGLRWAITQGARVVNLSLSTGREDYFGLFHEIADEAALPTTSRRRPIRPSSPRSFRLPLTTATTRSASTPTRGRRWTSERPALISLCRGCPAPRSPQQAIRSPRPM